MKVNNTINLLIKEKTVFVGKTMEEKVFLQLETLHFDKIRRGFKRPRIDGILKCQPFNKESYTGEIFEIIGFVKIFEHEEYVLVVLNDKIYKCPILTIDSKDYDIRYSPKMYKVHSEIYSLVVKSQFPQIFVL